MKKFIAIAAALVSFGAFADHHMENRHMVTISGWDQGVKDRSVDLTWSKNDKDADQKTTNLALNYAYAINGTWQVGGKYKMYKMETDGKISAKGDEVTTYGLFAIYNFKNQLHDTNYLSLGYDMSTQGKTNGNKDEVNTDTWNLEFGHRFSLGNLWGMNFNWSPSVMFAYSSVDDDAPTNAKDDKYKTQSLSLNVIKVDVLF